MFTQDEDAKRGKLNHRLVDKLRRLSISFHIIPLVGLYLFKCWFGILLEQYYLQPWQYFTRDSMATSFYLYGFPGWEYPSSMYPGISFHQSYLRNLYVPKSVFCTWQHTWWVWLKIILLSFDKKLFFYLFLLWLEENEYNKKTWARNPRGTTRGEYIYCILGKTAIGS